MEMPLSRSHPNRIRMILTLKGWSVQDLAERVGVSRWKTTRIIEGSQKKIEQGLDQEIAKVLGFSYDEVFSHRPLQNVRFSELRSQPLDRLGTRGGSFD